MKIPWITTSKSNSSLEINGIYTPLRSAFDSLTRFLTPVYFYNGNEIEGGLEATPLGSSLNILYRNRYLKVTCRHIADNAAFRLDQIIHYWKDSDGMPRGQTAGKLYGIGNSDCATNDGEDFVIAEFVDLADATKRDFLSVSDEFFLTEAQQRALQPLEMRLIGYPLDFVTSVIAEGSESEIRLQEVRLRRPYTILMKYVDRSEFDSEFFIPMAVEPGFEGQNPNGLSGSPVFNIYSRAEDTLSFGINGLVATANQATGRVNLLPARALLRRLNEI